MEKQKVCQTCGQLILSLEEFDKRIGEPAAYLAELVEKRIELKKKVKAEAMENANDNAK